MMTVLFIEFNRCCDYAGFSSSIQVLSICEILKRVSSCQRLFFFIDHANDLMRRVYLASVFTFNHKQNSGKHNELVNTSTL